MRISDWSSDVCSSDLLALLFAVALLLGIEGLWKGGYASGTRETIPASPVAVIAWLLLIGATLAVVRAQRERYLTLIFISVIGLVISLGFVHLSAPDLALTQDRKSRVVGKKVSVPLDLGGRR